MKHWVSRLFRKPVRSEQAVEDKVRALEEKYFRELVCQAESVDGQFEEYVEHLRGSVDDCIKKYCVLNDLFERKMAKKMSVIMQTFSNKLVDKFKEIELERDKQEKQREKKQQEEKKHEHR
jgi:hypothetical protein